MELACEDGELSLLARVDHVVYATPDLNAAIEDFEKQTGVRPTPAGRHPGQGTRNALVALGPGSYLEIIGPDPGQPRPRQARPFGIDELHVPRIATWAAKSSDLATLLAEAAKRGIGLGQISGGSRKRPDGVLLTWRYTDPCAVVADGIVPFFIDWGDTEHPSHAAAPGARFVSLRAEHPEPERIQRMLGDLGLELAVARGARPGLSVAIETPGGLVELH